MSSNNVRAVNGIEARDLPSGRPDEFEGRVTVMVGGSDMPTIIGVRRGLECHGLSVVAEAVDADEAVEAAMVHQPHVCLLDVDMPGGGIDAADRIIAAVPETKIAILSGAAQQDELRAVILAGADGYLPRTTAPERLTAALTGLVYGEAALPRAMTGQLVRDFRASAQRTPAAGFSMIDQHGFHPLQTYSRTLYFPRFVRHFRRRRRAGMSRPGAWASARARMGDYQ